MQININLTKETILKNKYLILIGMLLLLTVYFFVIPKVVQYVQIKYVSYKIDSIVSEQGDELLGVEMEQLSADEIKEINAIKEKYRAQKESTKTNYDKVITEYKNKIIDDRKKAILLGEDNTDISLIEKYDIEKGLLNEIKGVSNNETLKTVIDNKIKNIDDAKSVNIKQAYTETKPVSTTYTPKKYTFDLIEVKRINDVIVYDNSKLGLPIDLGITFGSLFNYQNAGINVGESYYNLHRGVDFKTLPYKNIVISFPENKKGKVVYAKNDGYGNHLIIDTDTNERFEYAHLEDIGVKEGDTIVGNQKIATTGNTGLISVGYHLHHAIYKDGFLSTFDWGADIDKRKVLSKFISTAEIDFILEEAKKRPAGIEQAIGIYLQFPNDKKNKDTFLKILSVIDSKEKAGIFTYKEILNDKYILENINNNVDAILVNMITAVENIDGYRKEILLDYVNKESIASPLFDKNKVLKKTSFAFIDPVVATAIIMNTNSDENTFTGNYIKDNITKDIDFGKCSKSISNVYNSYNPMRSASDKDIFSKGSVENINKLMPYFIEAAEGIDIANRINKKFGFTNENKIDNCEVIFIEIGKWYQEHTLGLENPNKSGILQVLTENYYTQFPDDKGKDILSKAQYIKQMQDSMEHSFGKLSYLNNKDKFRDRIINKDFILKYLAWSFHGLVGTNPEQDYYTSNNLLYSNLQINDVSAKNGATGYRDGVFTFAVKLSHIMNK